MSMTAGQTGVAVSPVFVPDLRPAADAAAQRRQTEPVLPVSPPPATVFPPVSPPSAVGPGEVGRSLLAAASMDGGGIEGGDERRLKPWGVAMLPHEKGGAEQAASGEAEAREPAPRSARAEAPEVSRDEPRPAPAAQRDAAPRPAPSMAERAAPDPAPAADAPDAAERDEPPAG